MGTEQGAGQSVEEEARRERERRVSSLALRYRAGDGTALGDLYAELESWIHAFLRPHLSAPRSLPTGMDPGDLYQQACVALAEAALDWQPGRNDSFVPYFARSFPWRIDRYLKAQTPARRTRTGGVQLHSMPHDALMEQIAGTQGLDGRDWDDALGCAELVGGLPALCRQVVSLHLYRGLSFAEVGQALGIAKSVAHGAFNRAISLLRSALAERGEPRPNGGGDVDEAALRRCVETIHRLAPRGAPLPGRETLCRAAGLTWREHLEIMARLRTSGCVVGRRRGSAGRLACASASETLTRLRA